MMIPRSVQGLRIVIGLLPRIHRSQAVAFGLGILVQAASPVAITVVTGLLIGSIPETVRNGFDSPAGRHSIVLLIVLAALVVLNRALSPLIAALSHNLGRFVDRHLQERTLRAVGTPSGIGHLEDSATLDTVRIARGLGLDASRPSLAVEGMGRIFPLWLQAIGSAAVLLVFHWWLAILWILAWPFLVLALQREYMRVGQVGYGQSKALRRAEYLRDLALTPAAAKELRLWGMLEWLVARFDSAWYSAIAPVWKARKPRAGILAVVIGTILVLNLASYGLLAHAAATGDISLAALAVFTQAMTSVNTFTAFDDSNAHLSYAAVAVPKVLELENSLASTKEGAGTVPVDAPVEAIRFESVSFGYPGAQRRVLDDFDLTIPAGRSLAIVGDNGAGKTSLVKLMCGLYQPDSGRITVDGTDLSTIAPAQWHHQVAALFQDFVHYHLSVSDNIALGAPHDPELLREAAARADILELIEGLPKQWDTILSREYTGGTDLSGGQWQRIALARAFFAVAAGARVLILDEPTAALDVRAEARLYERFLDLTAGLTTCLISHRFSTVRRADRIIVVRDGRIVEDGGHDELMAAGGRYAEMFTLQAARFIEESHA
ncbi:MAG TPA: ABC transporter ATP-binding protein [Mycobacteriales bacterium]|nr:ABC transporter ATP-binding protein [Mycobacteriales bacterium]